MKVHESFVQPLSFPVQHVTRIAEKEFCDEALREFSQLTSPRTQSEVKGLNKGKFTGIIALTLILVSLLAFQQGYAIPKKNISPLGGLHRWTLVSSVSDPTGDCVDLGLNGGYGNIIIVSNRVVISLQHATPNSAFTISVGYQQTNGGCDGTWQPVGSLNTDNTGSGILVQQLSLPSGHSYIFEFHDSAGNLLYATDSLQL